VAEIDFHHCCLAHLLPIHWVEAHVGSACVRSEEFGAKPMQSEEEVDRVELLNVESLIL